MAIVVRGKEKFISVEIIGNVNEQDRELEGVISSVSQKTV